MRPPMSGVLVTALRPAGGGGVLRRPPMASLSSPSRRKQPAQALSRSALKARDALVLEHLPLADTIACVMARRLFPLVEREDLIQVAREALVRSAPRCRSGEPRCALSAPLHQRALQHHLRDRVRLVRMPRRLHEQGQCPLGHLSLDATADGEPCLLDQLAAPEAEPAISEAVDGLALEQLVEQLPQPRPRPCGSPSWRACRSGRRPQGWRSAACRCSGPRRRPSLPCASSWGHRAPPLHVHLDQQGRRCGLSCQVPRGTVGRVR
jgi:hypothetical protein